MDRANRQITDSDEAAMNKIYKIEGTPDELLVFTPDESSRTLTSTSVLSCSVRTLA